MLNESTAIIPMKEYLELLKLKEEQVDTVPKNDHLKVVMELEQIKRSDIAIKALASILSMIKRSKQPAFFDDILKVLRREKIGILINGDVFIYPEEQILPEHIKLKAL